MQIPNATVRRPAFLQSLEPHAEARPAQFSHQGGARPPPRSGPAYGRRQEPPPGPSPEELAALRVEAMQRVAHAVEVLRLQSERLAEQARSDALEIGFLVARRILEAELATGPDALFALVRGALKRAGDSRRVSVRLHPLDVQVVSGAAAAGELQVATAAIEVSADPSLEPGDVVVDTDFGTVDGRLKTRLEELHRAAATALEEGAA